MSEKVASLYAEVSAKTEPLEQGLSRSKDGLTKLNGGLNDAVRQVTGFDLATLGAGAALGGLAAGLKYSIEQAMEAERVMALTESTITATGGAAGLTAEEVARMASRLSLMTGIQDDVIQSGQNMLLTFKGIKGDNFERATAAMNDMAVAMNGGSLAGLDLKGTAVQLGKALNDPIAGISALSRVGVTFTQSQKDAIKAMVEMGDTAGAQALILAELESEFGGAAVAAGDTLSGSLAKLKNVASELAETLGTGLIPGLNDAAQAALLLMQWTDKINAVYAEQKKTLETTGLTYDDYADQLIAAAIHTDDLTASEGELIKAYLRGDPALKQFGIKTAQEAATKIGLLTEQIYRTRYESSEATRAFDRLATAEYEAARSAAAGADRWQGLADALGVVGQANFDLSASMKGALDQGQLLSAALSGTISQAAADYQSVIAETTPQISGLTAELARYEAAQGKTFTVTTAASASIEEYELAQIRAATAAQALAEYTGDSREEYLELKIAADGAAEKVGALGDKMGISQSFTADYTRQIQETNGSLAELKLKQEEAEAQLERTTAQFIFQQIAAQLDAEAALEVGRKLGLVDEASYNTAKAVLALTKEFDTNGIAGIQAAEATPQYLAALGNIHLKTIAAAEGHSLNLTPAITTTKDKMIEAAEKADEYRDALGRLNGTSATTTVHTNHTTSGSPYVPPPSAPPGWTPPQAVPQATGGDWMVNGPTLFLAGEAGPERATFTPMGGSGGGNGDDDLAATLRSLPGAIARAVRDGIAASR